MQIHFVCLKTAMRKEIWIIWGGKKKNTQDQSQLVSLSFAESQGQIKICTYPKFAIAELRRREVWDTLHYIYKWTWIIHAHVSQGLLSICVKAPSEVSESSGKVTTSRLQIPDKRCETINPQWQEVARSDFTLPHPHRSLLTMQHWHCRHINNQAVWDLICKEICVFLNLYLYTKTKVATWHYHKHKCHLMKPTDIIYPSSKTYKGHTQH